MKFVFGCALAMSLAACSSETQYVVVPYQGDAATAPGVLPGSGDGGVGPVVTNDAAAAEDAATALSCPYVGDPSECYPTKTGYKKGEIAKNFTVEGFLQDDTATPINSVSASLTKIQLADYWDPELKRDGRVLFVLLSAVWCGPCNQETDAFAKSEAKALRAAGVITVQSMIENATQGSDKMSEADLRKWVKSHKNNFTTILDPGGDSTVRFVVPTGGNYGIPAGFVINLKTMEIMNAWANGLPSNLESTLKALAKTVK